MSSRNLRTGASPPFKVELPDTSAAPGFSFGFRALEIPTGRPVAGGAPIPAVKWSEITLKKGLLDASQIGAWNTFLAGGTVPARMLLLYSYDDRGNLVSTAGAYDVSPRNWQNAAAPDQSGMAIEKIEIAVEKVERVR